MNSNAKNKFTVTRSCWARGTDEMLKDNCKSEILLRNKHGEMCCLGFYSNQIDGHSFEDIESIGTPQDLDNNEDSILVTGDEYHDIELVTKIVNTNDKGCLSDKERENILTGLFKKIDVEVIFTD